MKNSQTVIIVLGACLAVAVLVICYLSSRGSSEKMPRAIQQPPPPQQPPRQQPIQKPTLVLFSAEWCGNCTAMKPAWEEAASMVHGKVDVLKLDDKVHGEQMRAVGIKGFPSIRLYPSGFPNGNHHEYKGDRSAKSIADFALM